MSKISMTKTACHLAAVAALAGVATSALATNGMYMEGYGPIATGMGGASQAVDQGNAAMAQNPATLGMMADGTARLDVALGILGPNVKSSIPAFGMSADSGGTSYIMPAFGYARRNGALTYGIGMFAQGGMGTEYAADSFMALGSGEDVRSELGVGNVIFPFAYQVNPNLTVGATFKFMWSSLDMKMAAPGATLAGMVTGASGNLAMALGPLGGAPWARINFSDSSDFSGAAKSTGFGASLGATYRVNPNLVLGASYLLKSSLDDMTTAEAEASMTAIGGFLDKGKITVVDFQMPAVLAFGAAWQASPSLQVAADIKRIGWNSVMKSFKMRYDSAMMGGSVSFAMPQNWEDQTVLNLGLAWKANQQLTLRAGLNLADNPVPDAYVNPLFPATVKNHVTLGMGYKVSDKGEINAAVTFAPKVTVTSGAGPEISHSQTNWQFMYSHSF
ncbi:MAG: outer membrane protein transport protein [Rhodoferax sp.]|uniref:OmpP1/FadL family transporter n=1 Tax=Rhodoferax sp. TaxID=50421 RepID=UPI001B7059C5|nr:DUF5723 family protein [Rhodoferax sp.]MBP9905772.1 outer membrane protein transport protein [Rhodoferax sp.]